VSDFRSAHSPKRLRSLRGPPDYPKIRKKKEDEKNLNLEGQLYGARITE